MSLHRVSWQLRWPRISHRSELPSREGTIFLTLKYSRRDFAGRRWRNRDEYGQSGLLHNNNMRDSPESFPLYADYNVEAYRDRKLSLSEYNTSSFQIGSHCSLLSLRREHWILDVENVRDTCLISLWYLMRFSWSEQLSDRGSDDNFGALHRAIDEWQVEWVLCTARSLIENKPNSTKGTKAANRRDVEHMP